MQRLRLPSLLIRIAWTFVACLLSTNGRASSDPQTSIDSLHQVLHRTPEDTARVNLYFAMAKQYAAVQPDSTFALLRQALKLSQKVGYTLGTARCLLEIGYMEGEYGELPKALTYLKRALPLVEQAEDSTLLWDTYQQIGWVYRKQGLYARALRYCQRALSIAEQTGDSVYIAAMRQNLSVFYLDTKEYDKAIAMLKRALITYLDFGHPLSLAGIYSNIADAYAELKDFEQSAHYAQLALQQIRISGDKVAETGILIDIAQMHVSQQQYDTAFSYARQVQSIAKEIDKFANKLEYENVMGDIYQGLYRYQQAKSHYENARTLMTEHSNLSTYIHTYKGLIKTDSLTGNFQGALANQQRLTTLKDSVANIQEKKAVEELKIKYETEQKDQEIMLLQAQTDRQQLKARQQQFIKNSFIAGSLGLCLLLGLGYNRYRFKQRALGTMQRQNQEIQAQKEEVEQKNHENQLLLKEVHHRVKNNLQIVLSILNAQADSLRDPQTVAAIRESQHRVHSMALIHQSLYQSDDLSQIQAQSYLREMVETVCQSYRPASQPVRLQLHIEDVAMDMSTAVPVGLILTELVTNACKHALNGEAPELRVSLQAETSTQYRLTVADNGPGLPPDFDVHQSDSLGLQLVQGLAQQLDGELVVEYDAGARFELLFQQAA